MPAKTEAWWVCGKCKVLVAKAKSSEFQAAVREHLKVCPEAGCRIQQVPQGTKHGK